MEPKEYPKTDADEIKAITIFKDLVDLDFVRPHIQERNTTPNIDGFLELTDQDRKPIGKLDVQIKKIPAGQTFYRCESELVSYSERTPALLLICVDVSNRHAFWKRIYRSMPEYKPEQLTFTIHFSPNSDAVDSAGIYLQKWREIVYEYLEKLSKYPSMDAQIGNKLNLDGITTSDCIFFQHFIDTVNNLFDNDFVSVKEINFPGQWKLGIGASQSDDKRFHYKIYTIPYGYPSPLITRIDKPFGSNRQSDSNTINEVLSFKESNTDPITIGKQFVFEEVQDIAKKKSFPVYGTKLAQEILIAFIDLYHICLGLKPLLKQYLLNDVDYAINQYLFNISRCSFQNVAKKIYNNYFVDLNVLSNYLRENPSIASNSKGDVPPFFIISQRFPIKLAFESLHLLKVKKVENIYRTFGLPDIDYSIITRQHWIWSGYSLENEITSVKHVLNTSLEEYKAFVEGNRLRFPISPYLDTSTSIVFEYERASLNTMSNSPSLNEFHIVDHNLPKLNIVIKDPKNERLDTSKMHEHSSSIILDGNTYSCINCSFSKARFLFDRTPSLNLVYRMLRADINKHYGFQVHDGVIF